MPTPAPARAVRWRHSRARQRWCQGPKASLAACSTSGPFTVHTPAA